VSGVGVVAWQCGGFGGGGGAGLVCLILVLFCLDMMLTCMGGALRAVGSICLISYARFSRKVGMSSSFYECRS